MWLNLLFSSILLIVVVGLWFGVYYWVNPRLKKPDGNSSVMGECGDTMDIRLRFARNRVSETSYSTVGCLYSMNCIAAASDLAKGKIPDEVLNIDAEAIQKAIGGLPRDHMHCATVAVGTLREAINDYMRKSID